MPLPFGSRGGGGADEILPSPTNEAARRWLAAADWPQRRLALHGPEGCGKTLLAQGWATAGTLWFDAGPAERLIDLAPYRGVVIDGADRCRDEAALLHWLNAGAEAGLPVLLTGRLAPARWPVRLADLRSRLRATQAVAIDPPDDALLRALLARLFAERQLVVPAELQDWLLLCLPRTAACLRAAVRLLDEASLARGQPISRILARACLTELMEDERA